MQKSWRIFHFRWKFAEIAENVQWRKVFPRFPNKRRLIRNRIIVVDLRENSTKELVEAALLPRIKGDFALQPYAAHILLLISQMAKIAKYTLTIINIIFSFTI